MTPTDSPSAYVPMRLYELLAQVLKHNWSTSINFLTKELDDNVQLYVNINTLSHMNLRREPRLSPFAYKLGTELANWFFDRTCNSFDQRFQTFTCSRIKRHIEGINSNMKD